MILQGKKNEAGILIFSYTLWKQREEQVLEIRYGLGMKHPTSLEGLTGQGCQERCGGLGVS